MYQNYLHLIASFCVTASNILSQRVGHGVPGVVVWSCSEITLGASVKINPHSL